MPTQVSMRKVKEWLCSDYDKEMRVIMEDAAELKKVMNRIIEGLPNV